MAVYSTDQGRLCPVCEKPADSCTGHDTAPIGNGQVRISRESKGRKGKPITLIRGLPVNKGELKRLAKQFKKLCGVGGSTTTDEIVIQGDQRQVLMTELLKMGYQVKLHGGG